MSDLQEPNETTDRATGHNVYIVDDDAEQRDSLRLLLRSKQVPCKVYVSAETFLQSLDESVRGCVVVGQRLPGMSGLELIERLSDRGVELPVIMITAYGNGGLNQRCRELGVCELVHKPFDPQDMLQRILDLLEENL